MPPEGPALLVGTHTVKSAVFEEAINLRNEFFCNPKQALKPEPVQSCTELPDVLPHNPLKSQIAVALAQDELPGNVLAQAGKEGGAGEGVLLKVRLQLFSTPALAEPRRSRIQILQVPLAFWPLFTEPR